MSMRLMIGIVQMFVTPGSSAACPSSVLRVSSVTPVRHWPRGLRWTIVSVVERALEEERAEGGDERQRENGRGQHRERLRKRQRVKQLSFLAGQGEHGNEGEQDDRH